jgi:hypothetical protein
MPKFVEDTPKLLVLPLAKVWSIEILRIHLKGFTTISLV